MKGKDACIAYGPDLIIGIGGGSVMDSAKAIWGMYEYPEFTIDDFHPFNPDLYNLGNKAKMVCIPTTSGTGAEATWAIVISRLDNDVWIKLEQAHKGIVPNYAILDPVFAAGMPPKLTAATGFDASITPIFSSCSRPGRLRKLFLTFPRNSIFSNFSFSFLLGSFSILCSAASGERSRIRVMLGMGMPLCIEIISITGMPCAAW